MTNLGSGLVTAMVAASIGLMGCSTRSSVAAPAGTAGDAGVVRVEMADSLSAGKRAHFDRIGGREAVARAMSGATAGGTSLASCGDGVEVTVTDYRLSRIPWSATGRAARPYRSKSSPPDTIRATVTLREQGSQIATLDVQARADGAKSPRVGARLDRLAQRLANEVAVAVARDLSGRC